MSEETHGAGPTADGAPAEEPRVEAPPAGPSPESPPPAPDPGLARRLDEVTRAYAELVNDRESFRRRLERERDRQLEAQKGEIAAVLLDTIDELALAIRGGSGDAERLAHGVRLIAENAGKRIESLGLSRVPAEGHLFDPSIHEAIDLLPTPDPALDGQVVEEIRAGWRLGDRVIRAARVRVGRHVPAAPAPADGGGESPPSAGE